MIVELVFPVSGSTLPTDHNYPLYATLSHIVEAFHSEESVLRFAPITGVASPNGQLQLGPHSCLRVRLPDDQIRLALPLAGKKIVVADASVRLGVPAVRTLVPAPMVVARLVTFKNAETPEQLLATARIKLAELGVTGEPSLPIHLEGERAGEPKRRVIRIKDVTIVGYSLLVSELSATDSILLQERGLGGRTQMGCGYFTPVRAEGK
jgi:CRISPR-associated protein Cas6